MSNLNIISLATNYTNAVDNFIKSCKKNNIPCKIIGLNSKFKGWRWRMKMYINTLKNYHDDDIIILSDCYDVIIQEGRSSSTCFLAKFTSAGWRSQWRCCLSTPDPGCKQELAG